METAKQHPKPADDRFAGMEVKGVFYSEKSEAGKAIIEACKQMSSPDPIPFGKYRGFDAELLFNTTERNYEVRLKGATSRNVTLGDNVNGNIIRLDNGIELFAESLSLAENDLENTKNQFETAKKEVQKPFLQEEELKTKLARLNELNILLNMDKRDDDIVEGEIDRVKILGLYRNYKGEEFIYYRSENNKSKVLTNGTRCWTDNQNPQRIQYLIRVDSIDIERMEKLMNENISVEHNTNQVLKAVETMQQNAQSQTALKK